VKDNEPNKRPLYKLTERQATCLKYIKAAI
jgi:hypothetical protein